ncbi:MAG TPA: hypothetical protein EYP49_08670 [Anaerolineae bacterium]|nr:hypothetical protein [Anaerolineae bacterium]
MSNPSHTFRWSAAAGLLAAMLVVVMFAIGLSVGPDLAVLEQSATPTQFGTVADRHAGAIQTMMVVDNLFVVAYVTAFVGLAALVRPRAPLAATVGLGFALLTALLDFTENSLTLHLVQGHLRGLKVEPGRLAILSVVDQVKFLSVYLAIALFASGLWEPKPLNRVMVVLSLIFPLIGGLAPISAVAATLRVLWMIPLLVCGALLLWRRAVDF